VIKNLSGRVAVVTAAALEIDRRYGRIADAYAWADKVWPEIEKQAIEKQK
jgi:hypothetical protein